MDIRPNNYPRNLVDSCIAHMHANGIVFDGCLKTDGQFHRFSKDSKKNQPDEWYVCHEGVSQKGNPYLVCRYGTWSGGQENYTYKSYDSGSSFSQDELIEIRVKEKERKRLFEKEQQEDRKRRIKQAQKVWNHSVTEPTLPAHSAYLKHKQVNAFGLRYRVKQDGTSLIVIPLSNIEGELQAIQCIQADGTKKIYGPKQGNFYVIGTIEETTSHFFVTEGYATGATIHQATGNPVVIAIDCGNLDAVLFNIRAKYPNHSITIAADDDNETEKNPGKSKAEAAANKYNCSVILPKFQENFRLPGSHSEENPYGIRPADFNDLYVHFGIDEVRGQLQTVQKKEKQDKSSESSNQSNSFKFRSAYSLTQYPSKSNWLIKPYFDIGSLAELFAEPGNMKTFLALDVGLCVASGIPYHGLSVRKSGIVFYIAGEGFQGIPKRLQAWSLAHDVDLKNIPLFVSERSAQFLDDASAKEVILAIEELKTQHGKPIFVVIDTLNRNFGPGDEKDNADMTKFIIAIDTAIRLRYGCTVLILHHPPLNDSKRGRGASALLGALDWAYSLKKDGEVLILSNTKVKDHEPPPDICFKPEIISLPGWIDEEDGQIMTSCVLKKVDGTATHKNGNKPKLTTPQKIAYDSLLKLCGTDLNDDAEGVHIDDWRRASYEAGISSSPKQDTKKRAFQRALDELRAQKLIQVFNDYWKPCGTRDIDGTSGHVPD